LQECLIAVGSCGWGSSWQFRSSATLGGYGWRVSKLKPNTKPTLLTSLTPLSKQAASVELQPRLASLEGVRATVMGLGRFGGGVGAARFLAASGADVLITDTLDEKTLAEPLESLRDLLDKGLIKLRLGGHNVADFTDTDLVVATPAIPKPWDNRFLSAARAASVRVTTEVVLLIDRLPNRARTIGITGSAGKSTTSALTHHMLRACGVDCVLGGNIGGSLLMDLGSITRETWVVLELSSAMLHWIDGFSPHVAVCTNLVENHIDWHGSLEHYRASKQRMLAWQCEGDVAVLGERVEDWPTQAGVTRRVVAENQGVKGLAIPGSHNEWNARVAVEACLAAIPTLSRAHAEAAARTFAGLPHRLERVGAIDGAACFNDSKSTTPQSTMLALDAFDDPRRVHLIVGGYDKGADLSPISQLVSKAAGLYTIGITGDRIANEAREIDASRVHACGDLERAVQACAKNARAGDVIVLSPGCASWDQFTNYEERGKAFANACAAIAKQ